MPNEIPIQELEQGVQAVTWQRGVLSAAVFIGSILFAKLAGYLVRAGWSRGRWGAAFALSKLLTYALVFAGVVAALASLGLPLSTLLLTSGALLVGIGFSLQHVTQDFVASVVILVEQSIRQNDFVSFAGTSGTVREIGFRATQLLTPEGTVLVVPNHLLVSTEVVNQSHPFRRSRLCIEVPVASSEPVDEAGAVIVSAADQHPEILADPPPGVRLEAIEPWGYRFSLIAWIEDPTADRRVSSQLRFAVSRAFAARGIQFPPSPMAWGAPGP
ncbi:MAG TPA: mechanosensitive ion channel domain-containing protein [Polyangia bacterium]|nr:mechanosensitive ion channel domain-containing protein [Polyangia bacterium]